MIELSKLIFIIVTCITVVSSQLLSLSSNYVCFSNPNSNIECRSFLHSTNTTSLVLSSNNYNKIRFNSATDILCAGSSTNIRCWDVNLNQILTDLNNSYADFHFDCNYQYYVTGTNQLYSSSSSLAVKQFSTNIQQIECNGLILCTVDDQNIVNCYNVQVPQFPKIFTAPSDNYVNIYMNTQQLCTLDKTSTVRCWDLSNINNILLLGGSWPNIIKFNHGNSPCFIDIQGAIFCNNVLAPVFNPSNTIFYDIAYNNYGQCALGRDLNLYCNLFNPSNIVLNINPNLLSGTTYFIGSLKKQCQNGTVYGLYYQNSPICAGNCAIGTFGTGIYSISNVCSGICPSGFFCPSGSATPSPCPAGSYNNLQSRGIITDCLNCPIGFFCPSASINGYSNPCQAGFYGSSTNQINKQCNGACTAGYRCTTGSISSTQFTCGSFQVYCPSNTSSPIFIDRGFYGIGGTPPLYETNTAQAICPIGSYCQNGLKYPCSSGQFSNITGLSTCLTCELGSTTLLTGKTVCENCDVGTFSKDNYCQVCPLGKFQSLPKQTICNDCSIGRYQITSGQTTCQNCFGDTYTDQTGSITCKTCDSGYINSNRTICSEVSHCNAGFYPVNYTECASCEFNTFSLVNSSTCTICPDFSYSLKTGSTTCLNCNQDGMQCLNGQTYISAGYWPVWNEEIGTLTVYKCTRIDNCETQVWSGNTRPKSNCPENRDQSADNLLCQTCASDYIEWNGDCIPCQKPNGELALVLLVFAGLYVFFLHYASNSDNIILAETMFLIYYLQVISIYFSNVTPPASEIVFFNLFNIQIEQVTGNLCIVPITPIQFYLYSLLSPLIGFGILFVWALIHRFLIHQLNSCGSALTCCSNRFQFSLKEFTIISYLRTAFLLLLVLYFQWSKTALDFLVCRDINGQNVLQINPSVSCDTEEYKGLVSWVAMLLFMMVVGLPVISFSLIFKFPSLLNPNTSLSKVFIWSHPYKLQFRYWTVANWSKRITLILFSLSSIVKLRFFLFAILFISYLFGLIKHGNPYQDKKYLFMDIYIDVYVLILAISCLGTYNEDYGYIPQKYYYVFMGVSLFWAVVLIIDLLKKVYHYLKTKKTESKKKVEEKEPEKKKDESRERRKHASKDKDAVPASGDLKSSHLPDTQTISERPRSTSVNLAIEPRSPRNNTVIPQDPKSLDLVTVAITIDPDTKEGEPNTTIPIGQTVVSKKEDSNVDTSPSNKPKSKEPSKVDSKEGASTAEKGEKEPDESDEEDLKKKKKKKIQRKKKSNKKPVNTDSDEDPKPASSIKKSDLDKESDGEESSSTTNKSKSHTKL